MTENEPDIIVAPDVFTKQRPAVLEQIRQKMMANPYAARPKAKGKWQEMVTLDDGIRYGVSCHREGNKITIIGVREALKQKRRIYR
jgi:hypothetical protein